MSNTLRQSCFTGDALVSMCLGFPRLHRIHDGYVRCLLHAKDLKVSICGRATFVVHCQTDGQMERDSSYRFSRGRELLFRFGNVLRFSRRELREAGIGKLAVPFK